MRTSLFIAFCFVAGVVLSRLEAVPDVLAASGLSTYSLCILLFAVGLAVGLDRHAFDAIRSAGWRLCLVPIATVGGTLIGVIAVIPLLDLSPSHALAVGCGLGYYSLSSVLIAEAVGDHLALIALLSNVFREIVTLTSAPLLARLFGPFAPVLAGGATTMDTTLPAIVFTSGRAYAPLAVLHGTILTLLVPILVALALA